MYDLRGDCLEKTVTFPVRWREARYSELMDQILQILQWWFSEPGGTAMVSVGGMGRRSCQIQWVQPREVKWCYAVDVEKAIIVECCG